MKNSLLSTFALVSLILLSAIGYAQTTYTRVYSPAEFDAGARYLIVGFNNEGAPFAMGYQKPNNRHALPVELVGDEITTVVAMEANDQNHPFEFTLGGSDNEWTFFDPLNSGYLNAPGGGNYLQTQTTLTDNGKWTIRESDTEDGWVPVSHGNVEQNLMRYNATSTLFGCYADGSNVQGLIHLFKAGSGTIQPEPDAYPENFAARVDGNSVILTWTPAPAATITVNARAYLIVGSTGDIAVPVDGVPVINDLNAADGNVAYNVLNDGSDTFTFDQMPGNTTFHFAIFPYTNNLAQINYKTDGDYPTTQVTIGDNYTLLQSNFANGLDPFVAIDLAGEQCWSTGVFEGTYYAKMNGHVGTTTYANEDWLITPNLLYDYVGTFETVKLRFMNASKFEGNDLLVKLSTNYNGEGDPNHSTWTDVTDMFDWSAGEYAWVTTEAELPIGKGPKLYVAFVYICNDVAATAWEVADVKVTAIDYDAVNEPVATSLSVYPNPAHEMVSFQLENDAQVSVFDMTGRMVNVMNMSAGEAQYDVAGFEKGVYFLNIRYADGKTEVTRFVKL